MRVMANPIQKSARVVAMKVTSDGEQNFLGAKWVAGLVERTPVRYREPVVLRLLSLSPHYFFDRDLQAEAQRNRQSRQELIDALVTPHLVEPGQRVLDYGCGPGFAARAVADHAAHVDAVDISAGVIACAKVLNGRENVCFWTTRQYDDVEGACDLAYSFAVFQHLTTKTLNEVWAVLADRLRPGGLLLVHFAAPENGWRTERECRSDSSLAGRLRMKLGLDCFGRTPDEMVDVAARHGFTTMEVKQLAGAIDVDDDISGQYWLEARKEV